MSSAVVAAPFDVKSFIPQPPVGLNHPHVQEIIAKVQAIIKEFEDGEREIPTPPTEAEREVYVAKVKTILADLAAQKPASFDIPAPPTGPPAGFDVESIIEKAKAIADQMKAEGKEFPAPPADFRLPTTTTTTEITIPQPPADFDLEATVEKAKGIFDAAQAEGKIPAVPIALPEGFVIPKPPTNLTFKLEHAAPKIPEGVNVEEIVAKVQAIAENLKAEGKTIPTGLPEGFKLPAVPQLPEGPEGETILAKVKATLATLAEDPKFTTLSIPEKVKAVIAKFDEEK
jgi:hypothetical protein